MLMEEERKLVAEYGRKMSTDGLARGTAGNISIYNPELGLMAISPSGLGYFDTTPEDVCVCDLDGKVADGTRKPSSEHGLHAAFYKEKAAQGCLAIVHTHSDYATTLACMGEPIRAVHYVIAGARRDGSQGLHARKRSASCKPRPCRVWQGSQEGLQHCGQHGVSCKDTVAVHVRR